MATCPVIYKSQSFAQAIFGFDVPPGRVQSRLFRSGINEHDRQRIAKIVSHPEQMHLLCVKKHLQHQSLSPADTGPGLFPTTETKYNVETA